MEQGDVCEVERVVSLLKVEGKRKHLDERQTAKVSKLS